MNTIIERAIDMQADQRAIHFATAECVLGTVLVARSERGICAILLGDDAAELARDLWNRFAQAQRDHSDIELGQFVSKVAGFIERPAMVLDAHLDLRGTAFERRVWEALRTVPAGSTATYAEIAERIGAPGQAQAVGEACAANVIAVAIPCHRIVRRDGRLAGYRWGFFRKRALLRSEGARLAPPARAKARAQHRDRAETADLFGTAR